MNSPEGTERLKVFAITDCEVKILHHIYAAASGEQARELHTALRHAASTQHSCKEIPGALAEGKPRWLTVL